MIAIPAIDLREGACVQLVGGAYDAERVRVHDPLDALKQWRASASDLPRGGPRRGAGQGANQDVISRLVGHEPGLTFTVGGGVRTRPTSSAVLARAPRSWWSAPARWRTLPGSRTWRTASPTAWWLRRT